MYPRKDLMSGVLAHWNFLSASDAVSEILPCCGSTAWAEALVARRPLPNEATLLAASDEVWRSLPKSDWLQAFRSHPRIGESSVGESLTAAWSMQEQQKVAAGETSAKVALAHANQEYERRFNRIFIVCATEKSPEQILAILQRRLKNDEAIELCEAAEQQRQITQIRLRKWLQVNISKTRRLDKDQKI
jgi:2-oxo-4-hydroxy-4-carboxy-5-ureidoimidazoline decarboxylase